jgi:lipoprotein NlpI
LSENDLDHATKFRESLRRIGRSIKNLMEIHILLDGEQLGPFSETQVRKYLGEGLVSPTDLASYDGAPDWQALDHILARLSPPDPHGDEETLPVTPDVAPADEPAPTVDSPAAPAPPSPLTMQNDAPETLISPPPTPAAESVPPLSSTQKTKRKLGKIVIQPILPLAPAPLEATTPLAKKKLKTGKTQLTLEPLRPTTALPPISSFQPQDKKPAKPRTGQVAFREISEKPTLPPTPVPGVSVAPPAPPPEAPLNPPALPLPAKTKIKSSPENNNSEKSIPWGLVYAGAAIAVLLIVLVLTAIYFLSGRHNATAANPENAPPSVVQQPAQVPAPIPADPATAADFNARGVIRQSNNDLDGALSDFTQALTLDPKNTDAFFHRGLVEESRGNLDNALADYNQVLDLNPKQTDAFSHRAYIKQAKGDLDGALADYTQALNLNPKIAAAYYNQGLIENQKGFFDAAIADYDHALDLDPKMDKAYYNRGNAKDSENNLDGAIADYTQALTLNPKLAAAYAKRGFARQTKGDADGALDDYAQAIILNPNMAVAYYNRGLIKVQKGDMAGAIDDSTTAITLEPKNGSAYCNRGLARFGSGDLDGAKADLEKFCELAPRDTGADDARVYLWLIDTQQNPSGDADAQLSRALLNDWNTPPEDLTSKIADFLLGHIRESELIADAAAASPDPTRAPPQYCKVWYFAGMKRLLAGDMKIAIADFNKSLATNQNTLCEYLFSQSELRALGQKPTDTIQAQSGP